MLLFLHSLSLCVHVHLNVSGCTGAVPGDGVGVGGGATEESRVMLALKSVREPL